MLTILNEKFADLIKVGKIFKTAALPEEADEPELARNQELFFIIIKRAPGGLMK